MDAEIKDLAIFGGQPKFETTLHVGRPNVGNRERLFHRINDILDRRWLTNNGPYVQEFERKISEMLDVGNCVVTCNGTVALEIAIRALGMRGEVLMPSFTFVATAHALQWQGISPVFCDIDPETHNIDPSRIESMITPQTTGIIGVHLWGRACEAEALETIAQKHGLRLLFDAAHAFGCTRNGRAIGSFGDAEVFSFHATKFFNTFEGGAIVTNDDELAKKIRLMKNFGFAGYDNVIHIGTNGKMSEVSAAMGLTGLESLDEYITINRENYGVYKKNLDGIPGIKLMSFDEPGRNNYQYVVCEIDESRTGISRDILLKIMHGENVMARRYFYPGCHRMEPYRSFPKTASLSLPNTDAVGAKIMSLPTGTSMDSVSIIKTCEIVRFAVSKADSIRKMLGD